MSDKFKVMGKQCDECLFSPERIVSGKRMKEIVQGCLRDDTFFVCHKATLVDRDLTVCCHTFFETYGNDILISRAAKMFGMVEFVDEQDLKREVL